MGRTLIKTQDYLDVFARFKVKENIEAVERMLTSHTEMELFERSQLGMLWRSYPLATTCLKDEARGWELMRSQGVCVVKAPRKQRL